ncbi:MAG TPA: Hsp20/alpha crystallin family protein [Granulicella sp.]|jgi:HSP20 family protein|nr:Hsp20/alpha crystallin family protein [Granulicella sp.]
MTTMTRFVPIRSTFHEITALQNRLNAMFQEFARPETGAEPAASVASPLGSFVPPVDVYEDSQALVLQLEIPGVKPEGLDVRLENQTLMVKGERKLEGNRKQENFHRIERRFGSFVRTFTLPQTVDTEALTASYDAGVLTISVAKKAEARPRQVKIEVGSPDAAGSKAALAV